MQILLSFVGGRDPFNPDNSDGPLLSLLGRRKFEKLYLFYTNQEYWERALKVQEVCKERQPEIEIKRITNYELRITNG